MKFPDSPTPLAVRKARRRYGLTQDQAAALIYRPGRTWRRYEDEGKGGTPMDPALWELFNIKAKATNGIAR